ncbi:MAG: UvrB/UvrC motif-containing protein [Clostridia bacterium]|nr:UvrB/UvrC motif-containing protein [Clostridia bacterium]
MLCSNCGIKNANFHYKYLTGGKYSELHLCGECAHKLGYIKDNDKLFNFTSILGDFLSVPKSAPSVATKCPVCSTSFDTVRRTGFLGCDKCYEVFADSIETMLSKIQPSTVHKGKLSGADGKKIERENTLKNLKEELKRAVIEEKYEQAAVLRDKIKEFEQKEDEQNG